MKKIVPCLVLMLTLPFAHAAGAEVKAKSSQDSANTLMLAAPTPPQISVDDIMRWDAEKVAFDTVSRRNFELIENKVEGKVAKLTFKSKDQTCVVTLDYVGALPGKSEPRSKLDLPKGWMLSAYQCSTAQARPGN